jgi:hypothetical protein
MGHASEILREETERQVKENIRIYGKAYVTSKGI